MKQREGLIRSGLINILSMGLISYVSKMQRFVIVCVGVIATQAAVPTVLSIERVDYISF